MSIFTHSSPLEDLQRWISLRGFDFYSAHKEGEVDPAATQGSVLWWLIGVWLACNAIVPVACSVSMGADYLRRKFAARRLGSRKALIEWPQTKL